MTTNKQYWDVELKSNKHFGAVCLFIQERGGTVTHFVDLDGPGIYLLRVLMTKALADQVASETGVKSVEKPQRIAGVNCVYTRF